MTVNEIKFREECRLRVLLIAQYYPPDVGGASTRVWNLQRILLDSGNQVVVVAAFPHYPLGKIPFLFKGKPFRIIKESNLTIVRTWVPGIPHDSVASRLFLYLAFSFSALLALPFLFKDRCSVVWALSPNYFCMIPALFYGKLWRAYVIHDVVDIWPAALYSSGYKLPRLLAPAVRLFTHASYLLANAVVTLSEPLKKRILLNAPSVRRVWVVPNAIEEIMFDVPDRGSSNGTFNLLYLGTLAPSNDFAMILDAASRLRSEGNIKFMISGSGECAEEISRLKREYGLGNVVLEGKPVPHDEVPMRLSQADALLLPLKRGFAEVSFPSKFGEYLASGKPVICSVEGELAKLIRAEEIAVVVAPGSGEQMAEVILKLRGDPNLRKELGYKAREYATANLSRERMIERVAAVMEQVGDNNYRNLQGSPYQSGV